MKSISHVLCTHRHAGEHGRATVRTNVQSGFTLAEVMVVLLIMSGILVSMAKVLSTARETRDQIHNQNEQQLAGPAILDLIEQDLRGLLTYSMRPSKVLRITSKDIGGKEADRIDLVTSTNGKLFELGDSRALRADYNEVGYVLRSRPDSIEFLEFYRREGFGADEEPFKGGRYTFLHDSVDSFEILVYDEDGPDAEAIEEWNTEAEPENRLPLRIELVLVIEIKPRLLDPSRRIQNQLKIEYRRVVRLPEALLTAYQIEPVPLIPDVRPPSDSSNGENGGVDLATDDMFGGQLGSGSIQLDGNGNGTFGGADGSSQSVDFGDLLQGFGGGGGG